MTETAKSTQSTTQDHPYQPPPAMVPYPHQAYNGGPYPPPGPPGTYIPPFFPYPPPPDGSHPEGAPNGVPPAPYMIGLPPGVVYAYPPHHQGPPFSPPPSTSTTPSALSRPKRKQVKMACTNCAGACKRCDEQRPCERCVKYGITDTCVDGQRKERKKGVKRGPYKRKSKGESDGGFTGSQPPSATTTSAAIHAVAQYAPEGYYPIYYPPGQYLPPPHEGPDGSPPHPNGQHIMPYYIHPGAYPPFPHYPPMYPPQSGPPPPNAPHAHPPAPPPPVQPEQQPQTINPADAARKPDDPGPVVEKNGVETNGGGKKRSRAGKNGEPKAKKAKVSHAAAVAQAEKEKEEVVVIVEEQTAHDNNEDDSDNSV